MLFPISSRVKGLLISSFMEWRGAYFLGLIYARIHVAMRGGGSKTFGPSWESTFLEPLKQYLLYTFRDLHKHISLKWNNDMTM